MLDLSEFKEGEYLSDPRFVEHHAMPKIKELIGKNKRVLDVGTRCGIWLMYYCDGTDNNGVGIDLGNVSAAKELARKFELSNKVDFIGGIDATFILPLEDKSFDVSVSTAMLEHLWIPGDIYMVEELIRVSKEKIILMTPRYIDRPDDSDRGRGQPEHINMFDEERFNNFLAQFGYKYNVEVVWPGYTSLIGTIHLK